MDTEVINIRDKNSTLEVTRKASLFFYGDEGNPFLAPRGLLTVGEKLIVSDTAQNRLFIWNTIPIAPYEKPDVVLGQIASSNTQRNAGGHVNAASLLYPSGVWSDGNRLIVADAWNHRVLIWNTFPFEHGQPADVVVGQPDFEKNLPNITGVGAQSSSKSLFWPYGVCSDGIHLWIADTGNRRVLFYERIPTENYQPADRIIGKKNFEDRDYTPEFPVWPYSVKISSEGILAVTDTQYYRVLIWNNWQDAFAKPADAIIGQQDLESSGQNQYSLKPQANTLNWCYDVCIENNSLWLADTGNSRILLFKNIPRQNDQHADDFFGTLNFETIGEHLEVGQENSQRLYWPFSVCISNNQLAVADTGNHRIVFYNL